MSSIPFDLAAWQKYFSRHQQEHMRRRLRAIRMFAEGEPRKQILQTLSLSPKTLSHYVDLYVAGGLAGLTKPIVKPRSQALTPQQQDKLREIVLNHSPEMYLKKELSGP